MATSTFIVIMGVLVSVFSLITTVNQAYPHDTNLSSQIQEVENAIVNLRNLEDYLAKTKTDILLTQKAKEKIAEEYNQAQ